LLILVPLWIAAPFILRFAYGTAFVSVTNVLRLLMLASVVWSAGAIVISGLNGLGHPGTQRQCAHRGRTGDVGDAAVMAADAGHPGRGAGFHDRL